MEINNLDLAALHWELQRMRHEIDNSVSASLGTMRSPDMIRLQSYLDRCKELKARVMAEDPVDAPHWATQKIQLSDLPAVNAEAENVDVRYIQYSIAMLDAEIRKCQSKDLPTGMIVHDSLRFDKLLSRLENHLNEFIKAQPNPIDLPEHAQSEEDGRK